MVSTPQGPRFPSESPAESPIGACCRPRPSTSGMNGSQRAPQSPPFGRGSSVGAVGNLKYVEDFEILETIGKGFFGVVYKVREKKAEFQQKNRGQPAVLVMKEPIIQNSQSGFSAKKIVSREFYMLRLLKHPNILKTRGICLKQINAEWKLNLLVDYCDCGSLQQTILHLQKPFTWLQRCSFSLDICRAMAFVHSQGFMHRDLTSMNVLLQSTGRKCPKAVVADFGLSCRIPNEGEVKQQVGTQNWMSPEMLAEQFYNEKSDVFSFGIILCQMIARIDADHDAGLYRTQTFGLDYIRFSCHCPSDTPLNLLRTAFSCCLWNASARPTFEQLVDQIGQIVSEELPSVPTGDDSRIGRSHSDAAIRSTKTASCGFLNGKRFSQADAFRPENLVIPEGLPLDNQSVVGTPTISQLENRMKELATIVAAEDPDYQESSLNPFSAHDRYRSIRKMKPGDRYFVQREAVRRETMKADGNSSAHLSRIDDLVKSRKRSASVPSLCFSYEPSESRLPSTKTSKRSVTLGLGEQRDLQGRITYSFREFDKKFTHTNRSGILTSHNDLSRQSNDSLDAVFPDGSDDEEGETSSEGERYESDEELHATDFPPASPPLPNGHSKSPSPEEHEVEVEEKEARVGRKGRSSVQRFIRRSSLVNDSQCSLS